MGVSKNRGTPKWMVKIMENPIKVDDLGVPLFLETPKSPTGANVKILIFALTFVWKPSMLAVSLERWHVMLKRGACKTVAVAKGSKDPDPNVVFVGSKMAIISFQRNR